MPHIRVSVGGTERLVLNPPLSGSQRERMRTRKDEGIEKGAG